MKKGLMIALSIVMLLAFTACGGGTDSGNVGGGTGSGTAQTPADDTVYELVYATPNGSTVPMYQNVDSPLMRLIEENSNGRIKFVEYLGGALAASGEAMDAVKSGAIDVTFDAPAWYTGVFPVSFLLEQPCLGTKNGEAASWVFYDLIHEIQPKEMENIVVLAPMCSGPRNIISSKPIRTLEDMKGVQLRTNTSMNAVALETGAVPVTMGSSELYEALQNHLVDGGFFSYESMTVSKYYEVCDYITDMPMVNATVMIYMGKAKFDSLPEDLQKIIVDTSYDFFVSTSSKFYNEFTDAGMEMAFAANPNLEWIHMSDAELKKWDDKLEHLYWDYTKTLDDAGYDGAELAAWVKDKVEFYNEKYAS
ncbi:MAG: TRAP transporter substrate-binding protein DctP [Clostridiales Family XIII bacterium]|jgi:TRAP-type C4-dicarboxylate transport system substrate-binding protein|nr:TRAP transporter substrate-binding protein DctP [Clostridiales Family XIII bacterium]